jgi:uroporphyrinogen decarboxylase
MKSILLKHLSNESTGRFPVWMMRQAGRYLPSYQEIRKQHSFWEMVTNPETAAKVSLTPRGVLSVDGIILFSDILTLPYSLSLPVEMREGVGPVVTSPLRDRASFDCFESFNATLHVPYVGDALKRISAVIQGEEALIGFAGAPWTVASYLIEGKANRNFPCLKKWFYEDQDSLVESLELYAQATAKYLIYQVENGAQVIQLFDTWLGEMPKEFFVNRYVPLLNRCFDMVRSKVKAPLIYFSKNAHHLLPEFVRFENVDLLSVDSLLPLSKVEEITEKRFGLQGNLDPLLLFCDPSHIRRETRKLVAQARELSKPAIMNLGHGILPGTPVENARAFVEEARQLWV